MVPVQHVGWMETDLGYRHLTETAATKIRDCLATVEDYGFQAEVVEFQYPTWLEGTLQAADYVNASVVYAAKPAAAWATWGRFLAWLIQRGLERQERVWYCDPKSASALRCAPILSLAEPAGSPRQAQ